MSEHLEGKELATSGEMVRLLNSCRSTVIDPQVPIPLLRPLRYRHTVCSYALFQYWCTVCRYDEQYEDTVCGYGAEKGGRAQGREMDFLAGIKKRGSHVGLTLSHGGLVVDKVTPGHALSQRDLPSKVNSRAAEQSQHWMPSKVNASCVLAAYNSGVAAIAAYDSVDVPAYARAG